uniref:Uncharacterized protein n=1 Tax=Heterosigma akashiwo TaxID=2829 RepID=A0A7S4D944_HETAK
MSEGWSEKKKAKSKYHDEQGNNLRGAWSARDNVTIFRAAIRLVHITHNQTGQYLDVVCHKCCLQALKGCGDHLRAPPTDCPSCMQLRCAGCDDHPGAPHLRRKGDAQLSEAVIVEAKNYGKGPASKHCVEGDKGFVPRELKQARQYYLSGNTMQGLQTYTKILVAAHLFLRHDELFVLKAEQILWDLCIIDPDGSIRAFCFSIEGKSDDGPQYLLLYRWDECVDFCPVRHLLSYLGLWGITSGYLWPDAAQEPPRSNPRGVYSSYVLYEPFLEEIRIMAEAVWGTAEGVGTHTMRKTAYIIAVYRGGKLELIKIAARHKNIKSAERYYRAAQGQFEMDKAANESSFTNLSAWIMNKVDCRRTALGGNQSSRHWPSLMTVNENGETVPMLQTHPAFGSHMLRHYISQFFKVCLKVPTAASPLMDMPCRIVALAKEWTPAQSPARRLESEFKSLGMSGEKISSIMSLVDELRRLDLQNELRSRGLPTEDSMPQQEPQPQPPPPGVVGAVRGSAGLVGSGAAPRRQAAKSQEAPGQRLPSRVMEEIVKAHGLVAKAQAIQESTTTFDELPVRSFSHSERNFIGRCAKIERCLLNHFSGDLSAFGEYWCSEVWNKCEKKKKPCFARFPCLGKNLKCPAPAVPRPSSPDHHGHGNIEFAAGFS